ncbi:uncharacterized protein [Anabrus simplex]|uniref:uncharacterized protein n=1 Tax=Anabrus simplex TaxID=316456 RepID=UPI0035A2BF28
MTSATVFLLVTSGIVAAIVALPVAPDVITEVENVHTHVPDGPVVDEANTYDQKAVPRQRRRAQPDDGKGSVGVSVEEESRKGTRVKIDADRVLWKSEDGKSRLDVTGEWSKVIDGPEKGKPDLAGFIKFSTDF